MANEFTITIDRFQYYRILQAITTAACAIEAERCRHGITNDKESYYSIMKGNIQELLELKGQLEQLTGVRFEYVPSLA